MRFDFVRIADIENAPADSTVGTLELMVEPGFMLVRFEKSIGTVQLVDFFSLATFGGSLGLASLLCDI